MKVFVAGATGVLGQPVVHALLKAGHRVVGTARSEEKAAQLQIAGAEAVSVDLFDAGALAFAVEGSDVVLHLATRIPPPRTMRRRRAWAENDRLRRQASRLLVDATLAVGAELYIQESITFAYVDSGERWITEETALQPTSVLESALDAERETARFTRSGGRGVVLRLSAFYAPYAPSTCDTVQLARYRLFPVFGTGRSYFSSIHVDDAASAVVAALDAPAGQYNVSDDQPVPLREYADAMTTAFGFRRAPRLPAWLGRLVMGTAAETLLRSHRVCNRRFKAVTAWAPRFPSVCQGWRAVAQELATAKGNEG